VGDDPRPPTPYERFVAAARAILAAPKKDVEKEMLRLRRKRAQKRKGKAASRK
jgi:hypothetical protein